MRLLQHFYVIISTFYIINLTLLVHKFDPIAQYFDFI